MIIKGKHLTVLPDNYDIFKLSVSKAKTFKQCKRKYKFGYIDKLPKKKQDFQIFGSFLHQVLEYFCGEIISGYNGPDNVLMKKSFDKALNTLILDNKPEEGTYKDHITKEQKTESFEILKGYLVKRFNDRKKEKLPTFLHVEKPFNIDIDGNVLVNGFIDLIQTDLDGVLHVADYKTSKSKRYLKNDFMQLKTYAYAMCLEDPNLEVVRCSYIMLRFNFESIVVEFKREDVMTMEKEFEEYAELINKEKLFRATTSPLCGYCDYMEKCPEGRQKVGLVDSNFGEVSW